MQPFAMGKNHFLDGALLEVKEALDFGCDNGTAIGDSPEIPCCCDGASTAVVHKSKVLALAPVGIPGVIVEIGSF